MYYLLASVIINPGREDEYKNEFVPLVERTVKESGGKYLAAATDIQSFVRPSVATRLVIVEWPSRASLEAWWTNHGKQLTDGATELAEFHIVGLEGVSEGVSEAAEPVAEHTHTEECQTAEEAKEPAPTEASTAQQADTVAAE